MASYKDYKSISAAKAAGSMYFIGKDGKKKLAVTKEQLSAWSKKNKGKYKGSALTAWANAKGKNITDSPASSLRPKARPNSGGSVSAVTAKETAEVKKRNTEIKLAERARKDTGPNSARKAPLKVKLRGAEWMAANTSAAYAALTKSEASALGLPRTRVAAMQSILRNKKFKDGQGWDYSNTSKKKDSRSPDPLNLAGRGR
mgnify:CR=1 FL=1